MANQHRTRPISGMAGARSRHLASDIRRMVGQIVDLFHPERVVLFGCHAYGRPTADSDVDVLVVMPTKNSVAQAVSI